MPATPWPDSDPPPPEPEPPGEGDCCGSGCTPCVWDLYYAERERHRQAMREWQARRERDACTPQAPPA